MNRRLSEFVRVYDQAMPGELCDRMVALFDKSQVVRRTGEGLKSFDELVIDGQPEWTGHQISLEKLKDQCLLRYQRDCPGVYPDEYDFEAFRIKRYNPEQGDEFREHVDAYNLVSARRYLVCFWYLNDVADGGETIFPSLRVQVRPRRGRVVMFPPFWMFDHAGLVPRSSAKYIISTYFLFAE